MPRIPVLTLLLLFHGASGESGLTSDDGQLEDIEPEPPEYECVMALSSPADNWHNLTCFLKESIHKHSNITFGVCCNNEGPCLELKKKKKGKYVLHSPDLSLILPCKVCIFPMSKEKRCSVYVLYQIVKPEAPNSLTITYHKDAKEYIISFVAASGYLKDKLIHQVIIRKNNGTWEEVEELRFLQFRLLEQKLARGAKYEVKVRSKPDGMFYKGSWSGWSKSEHFQTSEGVPGPAQEGLPLMTITLSTLGTLLLFIMIVIVFLWEKRIKPYAWPHIPDHKTTLEQLCKKQRKSHKIIFNPDYFMDLHIHKVDGIQAKTQEECFLEPSNIQGLGVPGENTVPDNMLEECAMMQGIQLECPQDGSLCESGGTSLTTLDGSTTHELEGRNLGVMQLYDRPNVHNRTLKDTGAISGQVICGKNNSEIPELLTNAIRVLRQEEAYVTMSAFPPTGITQRRQ